MWEIYEKKEIGKTIHKVPQEVLRKYEAWKKIVELQGIQGLKLIKGFHDEILKGQLKGLRSSRLNKQWRVIYKADSEICEVYVIEINPHTY